MDSRITTIPAYNPTNGEAADHLWRRFDHWRRAQGQASLGLPKLCARLKSIGFIKKRVHDPKDWRRAMGWVYLLPDPCPETWAYRQSPAPAVQVIQVQVPVASSQEDFGP